MIHPILRMGDARLLRIAKPVPTSALGSRALNELVEDMFETMRAAGGAGLAAPQIGVDLRVVIFGFDRLERYPDAPPVPPTVIINPVLTPLSAQTEGGWEGCLSVPGLRGWVDRFARLHYEGVTPSGEPIARDVDGFHARVVQHECDHLDGMLYPMRVKDFTKFGYTEQLFPNGDAPVDD
jgi:peptide deformylase